MILTLGVFFAGAILQVAVPPPGLWLESREVSAIDGKVTLTYSVKPKGDSPLSPTLIARCSDGDTDLFLAAKVFVWDRSGRIGRRPVRIRFDDQEPDKQSWDVGQNARTLFSRSAKETLRRLGSSTRFAIEYTPYGQVPTFADFDVSGADVVLGEIARACEW